MSRWVSRPATDAVRDCDLLIALGVRFDDRVTGRLEAFAKDAKIVHVDIDPSELNKNKAAHIPVVSDVGFALTELNKIVEAPDDMKVEGRHQQPIHHELVDSLTVHSVPYQPQIVHPKPGRMKVRMTWETLFAMSTR